jgi:thiosulfate/3-mercaptopyruvate sulfurtransferase
MSMRKFFSFSFLVCIAFAAAAGAANLRSELVIDAASLAKRLDEPNLVLLHVGDKDEYDAGHLPGARYVSLDDVSVSEHTREGLMLELPAAEDLRERLQKLGISDDSQIVVYYGGEWISPTTRIVFTLQYAGLGERTLLLDGGMPEWVRQGRALSTEVPLARSGRLATLRTQPLIADAAEVRAKLAAPGVAIVDARTPEFYAGSQTGGAHGHVHRSGHIKGARSIPFTSLADEQLRLRSQAELRAIFDQAGIQPGDTIIGYCHIGQQATAMLFAARLLGHPIRLYDGSFEDWSRSDDNPFEAIPAPGAG